MAEWNENAAHNPDEAATEPTPMEKVNDATKPASDKEPAPSAPQLQHQDPHDAVGAGAQRAEAPGPAPALNSPATEPPKPEPILPTRTDIKPVQGVEQPRTVVLQPVTATPDVALTAPANRMVTVGPGQSLSSIARLAYGDENKGHLIAEANRDTLPDPDRLQVGMTLVLPDDPNPGPKA